jgi:hypothetical protein
MNQLQKFSDGVRVAALDGRKVQRNVPHRR